MNQQCHNHPDRRALSFCHSCNRFFCPECLTEGKEYYYCLDSVCQIALQRELSSTQAQQVQLSDEPHAAAIKKPIRTGWSLWWKLNPYLIFRLALPIGLAYWIASSILTNSSSEESLSISTLLLLIFLGSVAIAVTSAALSQSYRGFELNPWTLTISRFIPWLLTVALVTVATVLGMMLLIVPGIIVAIRLFWADELALAHNLSPVEATRQSWELTKNHGWNIFGFQFLLGLAQYAIAIPLALLLGIFIYFLSMLDQGPLTELATILAFSVFFTSFYANAHACEIVYFYGIRAQFNHLQKTTHNPITPECSHYQESENFCSICGTDLREDKYDLIGKRRVLPVSECSHNEQSGTFCSNCGSRLREDSKQD